MQKTTAIVTFIINLPIQNTRLSIAADRDFVNFYAWCVSTHSMAGRSEIAAGIDGHATADAKKHLVVAATVLKGRAVVTGAARIAFDSLK